MTRQDLSISVRELSELVWRGGDLTRGRGGPTALEGAMGHRFLQEQREGHRTEVFMKETVTRSRLTLTISGRADVVCDDPEAPSIEEIKTTLETPLLIPGDNPVHWAQAKLYGYMLSRRHGFDALDIKVTYLNIDTRDTRTFTSRFNALALKDFFDQTAQVYLDWMTEVIAWREERDTRLLSLGFPFAERRPGQQAIIDHVVDLAKTRGSLSLMAARTGSGKTIAVLFGALLSLARNAVSQLLFLTAKTEGARSVTAAVKLLSAEIALKTVVLHAKARQCLHPSERGCDAQDCPLAKGHYDRLRPAMTAVIKARETGPTLTIDAVAEAHGVCPYWLARALAPYADIVIGDYNYFFDPRASLAALTLRDTVPKLLLVDEVHNLPERAREMFSATVSSRALGQLEAAPDPFGKHLAPRIARLRDEMSRLRNDIPGTSITEEAPGFLAALADLNDDIETVMSSVDRIEKETLDSYFELSAFSRAAAGAAISDRVLVKNTPHGRDVTLFAVDPSVHLQAVLKESDANALFFSGTLTPVRFFAEILLGDDKTDVLVLPPLFPESNRLAVIADGISTRFRDREATKGDVAAIIQAVVQAKPGNYLAFFPSFAYLQAVSAILAFDPSEVIVTAQQPDQTDDERRAFLEHFVRPRKDRCLLGLAVLGGRFSEGVDLPGDQLIGAVMVSPGLPMVTTERELIRRHFDNTRKDGFTFAYGHPGMNKVMQAAGRVIRSDTDQGVMVFVGERFARADNTALLKALWPDLERVTSLPELTGSLERFWGRADENR